LKLTENLFKSVTTASNGGLVRATVGRAQSSLADGSHVATHELILPNHLSGAVLSHALPS